MISLAIVDAGPLYAVADAGDVWHQGSARVFERADLKFVVPALAFAEACYLLNKRMGTLVEAQFVRSMGDFQIIAPAAPDLARMAALMEQYADFPLGAADASVVALAERLDTDIIVTTDRRHFSAIRPSHCEAFRLLPE